MAARGKAAAGDGLHRLVIVESPAKGKKIGDFLGPDYTVRGAQQSLSAWKPRLQGAAPDSP